MVRKPCVYGEIQQHNRAFGAFVMGTFLLGSLCQAAILVEIIKPLVQHHLNLQGTGIPNDHTKKLLCRVIVCTLNFCLTDFALLTYVFVKHKGRELSYLIVLNLLVNSVSLMCSYADCKKRTFPFLKWRSFNYRRESLNTKRASSVRNKNVFSSTLVTIKKKEQNLDDVNQKVNESCFSNSQLSGISTVQLTKAYELPENKINIKPSSLVFGQNSKNKTLCSHEGTKQINFVNIRKVKTKRRFLSFVPRRKNLKEFETTV